MDCPKCGYKRQTTDTAPDYECPKCGIIYAKYELAQKEKAIRKAADEKRIADDEERVRSLENQQRRNNETKASEARAEQAIAAAIAKNQPRRGLHPLVSWGAIGAAIIAIFAAGAPSSPVQKTAPESSSQRPPPTAVDIQLRKNQDISIAARTRCDDEIKRAATFPSTVDISWFSGTASSRVGNTTMVQIDFTAKNALGATLPYQAQCKIADDGTILFFNARPR